MKNIIYTWLWCKYLLDIHVFNFSSINIYWYTFILFLTKNEPEVSPRTTCAQDRDLDSEEHDLLKSDQASLMLDLDSGLYSADMLKVFEVLVFILVHELL